MTDVDVSDGRLHHIAVSVFGSDLVLFQNGRVKFRQSLIAALEDGPGVLYIGRKLGDDSRLQGICKLFVRFSAKTSSFIRSSVICVLL